MELLMIGIGAAFINNVVLSQFLGLCPFLGVSKKIDTAAGMGAAVIFVISLSTRSFERLRPVNACPHSVLHEKCNDG